MPRPSRWQQSARSFRMAALALLVLACVAHAQMPLTDSPVPRRAAYGFGLDEFEIGGVVATRPPAPNGYGTIWDFLRSIGVNVVEIRSTNWTDIDAIIDAADPARNERVMPNMPPIDRGGNGREAVFYPFDSAQSGLPPLLWT
ncbi:MAG TPA: hypothetical protein VHI13_16925 [Candidatus Kapabacteria bacterium]|nr:hypothetical protein [Candidatus Kapabacteria bacterium]